AGEDVRAARAAGHRDRRRARRAGETDRGAGEGARRPRQEAVTPAVWSSPGMKITVYVPDDVFEEAEQLARRTKRSRSEVYSWALSEYVARHAPDRVTEAMDRTLTEIGEPEDRFVRVASR